MSAYEIARIVLSGAAGLFLVTAFVTVVNVGKPRPVLSGLSAAVTVVIALLVVWAIYTVLVAP